MDTAVSCKKIDLSVAYFGYIPIAYTLAAGGAVPAFRVAPRLSLIPVGPSHLIAKVQRSLGPGAGFLGKQETMMLPADSKQKRSIWRRWLANCQGFAAGFLIYVVAGGLAGFALPGQYSGDASCLPFHPGHGAFAEITSRCPVNAVNVFWSVTLEAPRLLLTVPAIAIGSYREARLVDASIWLRAAIPMLLLFLGGITYWWQRRRGTAVVLLALIVGQILYIGFRM